MNLLRFVFLFLFSLSISYLPAQSYNKKLTAELDTILAADQRYRFLEAPIGSEQDKENMRRQDSIDYKNLQKVEKILAAYGYPGKSQVGVKHQSTVFLVIQHSDLETQEKYLPLLTKAANMGEIKQSSLAILTDRILIGKGEKQVYGSQLRETEAGIKIMPIADEPNVNIRRAKVGLQPLEVYLKQWNILYTLPTATKPNAPDMYFTMREAESSVEAIGGDSAIFSKLVYPAKAKTNHISGFVTVEFTVDKEGNTKKAFIVKSLGYDCDEEALRVIKEARFNNGTGEDYEMRMSLPFPNAKG